MELNREKKVAVPLNFFNHIDFSFISVFSFWFLYSSSCFLCFIPLSSSSSSSSSLSLALALLDLCMDLSTLSYLWFFSSILFSFILVFFFRDGDGTNSLTIITPNTKQRVGQAQEERLDEHRAEPEENKNWRSPHWRSLQQVKCKNSHASFVNVC